MIIKFSVSIDLWSLQSTHSVIILPNPHYNCTKTETQRQETTYPKSVTGSKRQSRGVTQVFWLLCISSSPGAGAGQKGKWEWSAWDQPCPLPFFYAQAPDIPFVSRALNLTPIIFPFFSVLTLHFLLSSEPWHSSSPLWVHPFAVFSGWGPHPAFSVFSDSVISIMVLKHWHLRSQSWPPFNWCPYTLTKAQTLVLEPSPLYIHLM